MPRSLNEGCCVARRPSKESNLATFFFDNDISFRIVEALKILSRPNSGIELIALRDRFAQDTRDVDWIPTVADAGWIIISRDNNQRRREAELKALKQHHATALYLRQSSKSLELYRDAARMIGNWPKITEWGARVTPGTLVRLDTHDKIVPL